MTQIKWKKISQYCIERNNYYISKYILADNANRFILWDGTKMLKVSDNSQELKDYAMDYDKTQSKRDNRLPAYIEARRNLHSRSKEEKEQQDKRSKQASLWLPLS
jgi:hypothetical protein